MQPYTAVFGANAGNPTKFPLAGDAVKTHGDIDGFLIPLVTPNGIGFRSVHDAAWRCSGNRGRRCWWYCCTTVKQP
ncbi:MAG: hypothetical protein R3C26_13540 [Calditrichia bacterium]